MNIATRFQSMSRQVQILIALTAVLAIGGIVTSLSLAADGEAFGYTRIALGILGVVGVALMLIGKDNGKTGLTVILVWAAIQTIFIADAPDGNYTRQLIDGLAGGSSSTTVNGEVTQFSAIGINLVGLGMLLFAYASRAKLPRLQTATTPS